MMDQNKKQTSELMQSTLPSVSPLVKKYTSTKGKQKEEEEIEKN